MATFIKVFISNKQYNAVCFVYGTSVIYMLFAIILQCLVHKTMSNANHIVNSFNLANLQKVSSIKTVTVVLYVAHTCTHPTKQLRLFYINPFIIGFLFVCLFFNFVHLLKVIYRLNFQKCFPVKVRHSVRAERELRKSGLSWCSHCCGSVCKWVCVQVWLCLQVCVRVCVCVPGPRCQQSAESHSEITAGRPATLTQQHLIMALP